MERSCAASAVSSRRCAASGTATARGVRSLRRARWRRSAMLESLAQALSALTSAGYSRDGKLDDTALDEALATAFQILKRMRIEQTWIMKRLAMRRGGGAAVPVGSRVWSR